MQNITTSDWLRSKIGPAPNPAPPERLSNADDPATGFFTRYLRPQMRVLHAYCGDGRSSIGLAAFVPMGEVTGIDPDTSKLRKARERSHVSGGGDVSFERGSLHDLPYGPDEFDAVLLDGALATEGSPERALSEVRRVLGPGGLLGVRHSVASSRVMTQRAPLIERALTRRDTVLRDVGGDPDMGLKQPSLLRAVGYVNLRVTSTTEQKTDDDLLTELSAGGFVPLSEDPEFGEDDPAVISFVTVVETVCWKPA